MRSISYLVTLFFVLIAVSTAEDPVNPEAFKEGCAIDVLFLVDMSNSIPEESIQDVRDYLMDVISEFNIGVDETHVSIIQFNTDVVVKLKDSFDPAEVQSAIDGLEKNLYHYGATCTAGAYQRARGLFGVDATGQVLPDSDSILRPSVPMNIILVTDGRPTKFLGGEGTIDYVPYCWAADCRCTAGTGDHRSYDFALPPLVDEVASIRAINTVTQDNGMNYEVNIFGISVSGLDENGANGGVNEEILNSITDQHVSIQNMGELTEIIETTVQALCPTESPTLLFVGTDITERPTASPRPVAKASIYFVLDKSASIKNYAAKCEALGNGSDCWQLFANFVEDTVTLVQEGLRTLNGTPDGKRAPLDWGKDGNLLVDVSGFSCSYGQEVPVTTQYVELTNSKKEFKQGIRLMRKDPVPDRAGTCPGQALERVLAKVETEYSDQPEGLADRFHFVIVVTDGLFWDGDRAPITMDALRERMAVTYGISIFGDKNQLTQQEREIQETQLALLAKDRAFLLDNFALTQVAESIASDFVGGASPPELPYPAYCGYGDISDDLDAAEEAKVVDQHGDYVVLSAVQEFKDACKLDASHKAACKYKGAQKRCTVKSTPTPTVFTPPPVTDSAFCEKFHDNPTRCEKKTGCYFNTIKGKCGPGTDCALMNYRGEDVCESSPLCKYRKNEKCKPTRKNYYP